MASPVTIPITPITIAKKEDRRYVIRFQNTGTNPIYITKQLPNGSTPTPSATVYDYYLPPRTSSEEQGEVVEVRTIAKFEAVAVGGASTLAIAKTFLII